MSYSQVVGTPTSPVVEVSPWGRRFAAWLIDAILLGIVPAVIMFTRMMSEMAEAGLLDTAGPPPDPAVAQEQIMEIYSGMLGEITLVSFIFTILSYLYYVLMHGKLGRTLGKMALGIKVIKADGTPCDLAAAAKRGVVHPLASGVPTVGFAILLLNGLWPLWDEKHQSLGDKLGGTYVVRKQPVTMPVSDVPQPPPASPPPAV